MGLYLLHGYDKMRSAYQAQCSDEEFAPGWHKKKTGSVMDLDNPTTFGERQWWLEQDHYEPLMIARTDEIAVRK